MRDKVYIRLMLALFLIGATVGNSYAATLGTNVKVPMPFNAGDTITISADTAGPFTNVTEYFAVSDGTKLICQGTRPNLGLVASGQNKTFQAQCLIPVDTHANVAVFVVFLEGTESYVGEPVPDTRLKLVARCPKAGKAARPCKYATARFWIQTQKQNP